MRRSSGLGAPAAPRARADPAPTDPAFEGSVETTFGPSDLTPRMTCGTPDPIALARNPAVDPSGAEGADDRAPTATGRRRMGGRTRGASCPTDTRRPDPSEAPSGPVMTFKPSGSPKAVARASVRASGFPTGRADSWARRPMPTLGPWSEADLDPRTSGPAALGSPMGGATAGGHRPLDASGPGSPTRVRCRAATTGVGPRPRPNRGVVLGASGRCTSPGVSESPGTGPRRPMPTLGPWSEAGLDPRTSGPAALGSPMGGATAGGHRPLDASGPGSPTRVRCRAATTGVGPRPRPNRGVVLGASGRCTSPGVSESPGTGPRRPMPTLGPWSEAGLDPRTSGPAALGSPMGGATAGGHRPLDASGPGSPTRVRCRAATTGVGPRPRPNRGVVLGASGRSGTADAMEPDPLVPRSAAVPGPPADSEDASSSLLALAMTPPGGRTGPTAAPR